MPQLPLYEEFKVANFRGFDLLEIDGLRRINVVVGRNNTGKTSLLEAMAVPIETQVEWPADALREVGEAELRTYQFRPIGSIDEESNFCWKWRGGAVARSVRDLGTRLEAIKASKQIFQWTKNLTAVDRFYVFESADHFGDGDRRGIGQIVPGLLGARGDDVARFDKAMIDTEFEVQIEAILRSLDARVRSVRALAVNNERQVYVDVGLPKRLPLNLLGQGMQRLMSLATHAYAARGGILFIDEIEIGLHHSYFERLWAGIRAMADVLDMQVVATTHSYECLAAATASESAKEDLAVVRLERGADNRITATTLSGERLLNAIAHGVELR